jgi:hypothetical protein
VQPLATSERGVSSICGCQYFKGTPLKYTRFLDGSLMASITSDELNFLVFRYLQESGEHNHAVPDWCSMLCMQSKVLLSATW